MSSWACETGYYSHGDCTTTPDATFSHPITLNLYQVGSGTPPSVGALITSKTVSFDIPFRPSSSPEACATGVTPTSDGTQWWDAATSTCNNGLATKIVFDFSEDPSIVLPDEVIFGVAYNTYTYGAEPMGVGGPYDALNVGLLEVNPTWAGTDLDTDMLFWDTVTASFYTDGGAAGFGFFRFDTDWSGYSVNAAFEMEPVLYIDDATHKFDTGGAYTFDVPVKLSAGASVYSLAFDVDFPACLGQPTVSDELTAFDSSLESYNDGKAGIAVYSNGGGTSAVAVPDDAVVKLSFANVTCAQTDDLVAPFTFGPRLECGASDGINLVACTGLPGTVTLDFNQAPIAIALDPTTVPPVLSGWTGATFSTHDPDAANTFTYSLVNDGATVIPGNAEFAIGPDANGNQLYVASGQGPLAAGDYVIRVRSTDQGGQYLEEEFTVKVLPQATLSILADTSTDSVSSVARDGVARKGNPSGSPLTLPLTFNAQGNTATNLKFKVNFDGTCLSVNENTTGSLAFEFAAPTNTTLTTLNVQALSTCTDTSAGTPAMLEVKNLSFSDVEFTSGTLVAAVTATGNSVKVIDNSQRGNCNASVETAGVNPVNAADYVATVLEMFDGDDSDTAGTGWLAAPGSSFNGSPYGCDSNQSAAIEVTDIVCTVHLSFNNACTSLGMIAPASVGMSALTVAAASADAGAMVNVPVSFDAQGAQIGALVFSLTFDPAKVAFDPSDADGDGNPDAIHFNLVDGQTAVALYDAAANKLNVAVFSVTQDMQPINGNVASVDLMNLAGGAAELVIDSASASTVDGVTVIVQGSAGGVSDLRPAVYLPMLIAQ